jgi:hypothetical protein
MPPVLQARTHAVTHREWTRRSPARVVAAGAGGLAVELGVTLGAVGGQVLTPYADDLHCHAAPMLSADAGGGLRSVAS